MKKIEKRIDNINSSISLWFINYPVSQVADIMLPWWQLVPVWEDQVPHIELARKVIKKINKMYKTKFPLPMALLSETPRLVGTDWNDKMSKSLWNTIYLTASLEEIKKGVNSMYTDPNKISIEDKWNIENHVVFKYLDIFYNKKEHLEELKQKYIKWGKESVWDWYIKKLLVEVLDDFISPIREKREYYLNNIHLVINAIDIWSKNMSDIWVKTLNELKNNMWILNYWQK
jgi:tryptophanyl-tRNA synthetase